MPTSSITNGRPHQVDQVKLFRSLIIMIMFVLSVVMSFMAIKSGNRLFMLGFLVLPFVLILMNRPQVALVLAVIMDATAYQISGTSMGSIGLFAKLLLVGSALLAALMGQRMWKGGRLKEKKPLMFFAAVIVLLMAVRGAGLRILGSSTWGGMMYINLFIGILVFLVLNGLHIQKKHVHWIVWGSLVAGLIGTFLRYSGFIAAEEYMSDIGASRLSYLTPIVSVLFPLGFALGKKKGLGILIVLLALGLIALTGFRSRLVGLIMITAGFGFFMSKNKTAYFFKMIVLGLLGWALIVSISGLLPHGMQRAISFIPGTHVDDTTAKDALRSIEWRLEIWEYCWQKVPDYLWIGRGSAFNVWETSENLSASDIKDFSPWFAFQTRSYHSGPLALLLDYGLLGFIAAGWLMLVLFKQFWSNARIFCRINTFEARYAAVLSITLLWKIFSFYAVYGDIRVFATLIANSAITMVVCSSVLAFEQQDEDGVNLLVAD